MVATRSSSAPQARRTISYKEIDEYADVSDSEQALLDEERAKRTLKGKFGSWTVRLDLSQSWERDAEPLPILARLKRASFGKNCLDQEDLLESVRNPRVRMNVRLGRLSGFMKMPIEVVTEISAYLEPLDLLHLSRTSKQFRALFLSKRYITVWRASREALGMTDCPTDLDEPAFASLVFEKNCHVCGAGNIDAMTYETRVKLCRSCRINFVSAKKILEEMEIDPVEYNPYIKYIGNLLPYYVLGRNNKIFNRNAEKKLVLNALYFKPDFVEMVGRFFLLLRGDDSKRTTAFVRNRVQATENMYEHGTRTVTWRLEYEFSKHEQRNDIGDLRKARILEKLLEAGHAEDEFPKKGECQFYNWEELVKLPYELKPKAWKTLYPKLQKIMEDNKSGEEKRNILRKRKKRRVALNALYEGFIENTDMADDFLKPTVADLLEIPEFKALVEDDSTEDIDPDEWEAIMPELVDIVHAHAIQIVTTANVLVRAAMRRAQECDLVTSVDLTRLLSSEDAADENIWCSMFFMNAFAYFKVKQVYLPTPVTFTEIVGAVRTQYRGRDAWLEEWRSILPWKGENMECSELHMLVSIALMRELDVDWRTATPSHLLFGPTLGCARCPTAGNSMTWMELLTHYVAEYEEQKFWRDQLKQFQAEQQIRSKPPYWTRFINTHDIDDRTRPLLHLPGTFEIGHVNPLGEELSVSSARDLVKPLVDFPKFDTAACEVCWRMGGNRYKRYSSVMLKQHLRSHHGKEPEARDVHLPREQ